MKPTAMPSTLDLRSLAHVCGGVDHPFLSEPRPLFTSNATQARHLARQFVSENYSMWGGKRKMDPAAATAAFATEFQTIAAANNYWR
jgi:hypothetical protein